MARITNLAVLRDTCDRAFHPVVEAARIAIGQQAGQVPDEAAWGAYWCRRLAVAIAQDLDERRRSPSGGVAECFPRHDAGVNGVAIGAADEAADCPQCGRVIEREPGICPACDLY